MRVDTLHSCSAPARRVLDDVIAEAGECVHQNAHWRRTLPAISVLIPSYHDDPCALIRRLSQCMSSETIEILVYDDGSLDSSLGARIADALDSFDGAGCLISADTNKGRSSARNRLQSVSRADWLLFVDADMLPLNKAFIASYLDILTASVGPEVVVGGFSIKGLRHTGKTGLHLAQSAASECIPASERQEEPGRYVFTSNVLVHRDIMAVIPFDPGFEGWGWEDVDWGLRAARRFPVRHIDNAAIHTGLDPAPVLLRKYAGSGANFARVVNSHPDEMKQTSLYRWANRIRFLPGRSFWQSAFGAIARLPGWLMPVNVRLAALKLYRATVYAGALDAR